MNDPHYYCVIMAGGLGTRFWPVSRDAKPKQFLSITKSGKSFLRLAWERVQNLVPRENIIVVSLERYRDLVLAEVPELEDRNLLMEPCNRNTASCIAYACYSILKRDPDAVVLTMPSDQVIDGPELFRETVLTGMDYAAGHDVLLTLGVLPRRADPNFGYIQTDGPVSAGGPVKVKTFTEKPSKELAQVFLESGEFLWNAGIFIWKASVIAEDIERYAPEVAAHWNGWEQYIATPYEKEYLDRLRRAGILRPGYDHSRAVRLERSRQLGFPVRVLPLGRQGKRYQDKRSQPAGPDRGHPGVLSQQRQDSGAERTQRLHCYRRQRRADDLPQR